MKLDGKTIQTAIMQLVEDFKFDTEQIIEIVNMGIKSAFKKDHPKYRKAKIDIEIDAEGEISIYQVLDVVATAEDVEDDISQIALKDAQKEVEDIEVDEQMYVDVTPDSLEFSRIAVQSAAQTIKQHLKQIEKERFFEKFQDKQGELLKGKVTKSTGTTVVVDIDGAPVVLPPKGQVPHRDYEIGEDVFVYLNQISKGKGGINLDITQSSEEFIGALIQKIVPEVEEGIVEIKKIVRIPGLKTKVVAYSHDANVDPVGVLVGHGGDRITIIASLLEGEKIDFVEYNDDPEELLKESLKPVDIKNISFNKSNTAVSIIVPENQKAMAIGKKACNIKLASQIMGMRVEIE